MLDASSDLIDRDGGVFPRAWAFRHVIPYRTLQGMMVWAALANDAGWSGCVLSIDSQGNATTHFANGGFVELFMDAQEWLIDFVHINSPAANGFYHPEGVAENSIWSRPSFSKRIL